jgi:hypothetical protein
MKQFILSCLLLFAAIYSYGQNNKLTLADVRQSWASRQGTIENATISLRTKGLYIECGLYLTFSARGVTFNTNGDSLEVLLNFTLPEGSIVHDSWLWVHDDIVKAHIFDRWTASAIYESIVKRRQDPSILVKNGATQYQLRVFPMNSDSTRRVKITWLQPINLGPNQTSVTLPFDLLKTSKFPVNQFDVLVWTDDRFQAPIMSDSSDVFESVTDSIAGKFYRTTLPTSHFSEYTKVIFNSPLQNGYYFSTFEDGDEKYYQLAVLPSSVLPINTFKKVAVLLDYESTLNGTTTSQLLESTKKALLTNLVRGDSFNLFYSGLVIKKAADRWLPADPDTIRHIFEILGNPLANYSNMQPLLVTGIQWVQQHGPGGTIVMASNSSQFANLQASNTLITDLVGLLNPPVPISIVDYNEKTSPYFYANGAYYYANSYLFSNLAAQSGGIYVKTLYVQTLNAAFESLFSNLGTYVSTFELYPSHENGFSYGRFNVGPFGSYVNLSRPILQIGKYYGEEPTNIKISGLLNEQPLFTELKIPVTDVVNADTLTREMWYGRYVQALESESQTNNTIGNIIFNSLAERVLSKYTAFLCLENPDWICDDCEDESQYTGTENLVSADSTLFAFPNPFTDHITIKINASIANAAHATFEIYDLKGQLVRAFDLSANTREQQLEWDGSSMSGQDAPAGIYLGLLKTGARTNVLKLVKVK